MTLTEARTWDYEAVAVGQRAQPIANEVTPDSIAAHASTSRSMNQAHYSDAPPFAMPTQIFSLAPKNRDGVAENNGMQIITAHATPFAKCEGRWFAPIRLGDTVTSVATVLEKYERRGTSSSRSGSNPTTAGARSWRRSTTRPSSSSAKGTGLVRAQAASRGGQPRP